jgi:hypothetical protein
VLRFLLSLRHPEVRSALMACNMTAADAREGWSLLETLGAARFEGTPPPAPSFTVIDDLLAWQTRWFAIAEATLGRRLPAVKQRVFLNLGRAYGIAVIASVQLFMDRLDELRDPAGRHGPDGPRALQALAERGLNQAVIDRAQALLLSLRDVRVGPDHLPDAAIARDEAALWRWYLEWAVIARAGIKERALLRRMGLRMASGAADEAVHGEPPAPGVAT